MTETAKYLTAVCCLETARAVREEDLRKTERLLEIMLREKKPEYPTKPHVSYLYRLLYIPMAICILLALFALGLTIFLFLKNWLLGIFVLLGGGFCIMACIYPVTLLYDFIKDRREKQDFKLECYQSSLELYEPRMESWKRATEDIPKIRDRIRKLEDETISIDAYLSVMYSRNIIPSRYRTRDAVMYLQEWFSSCQSEDMDSAIIMYEEYRAKNTPLFRPMYSSNDYAARFKKTYSVYTEAHEFLKDL